MEKENNYEKYGRAVWVILTSFILMKSVFTRIFGLSVLFDSSISEWIILMSLGALLITIVSLVLFIISLVKVMNEKKNSKKYFKVMLWVNLVLAVAFFILGSVNYSIGSNTLNGVTTVVKNFSFVLSEGMYSPLICVIIALAVDSGISKKIKREKALSEMDNKTN